MKHRSFLAFPLPDSLCRELGKTIDLMATKVEGMAWVKPENLHCTIKFFGEIEEQLLLGELSQVIEEEVARAKPFALKVEGLGVFPNWRYPKVIWAGLTGETEAVFNLHQKLEDRFAALGLARDQRTFRLHLTLGRAKKLKETKELSRFVERQVGCVFGKMKVDSLTLYKSMLTGKIPLYSPLRQFRLGEGGM